MQNKTSQIKEIIKTLESKYKWMKISNTKNGYMIEDIRFQPYSVMAYNLTETELLKEVKIYLENV
jgi:hypothetical protein